MENGVQVLGETAFADHYVYRSEDLDRMRAQAQRSNVEMVLTTEKDAGKLAPLLRPDDSWWALRLQVDVRRGQDALQRLLCEASDRPKFQGDVRA
jgi:tetraacyldisaccharide 4'-kinase